jgi:hypothetical protein
MPSKRHNHPKFTTITVPSSGSSPQLLVLTCLVCPTSNNLIARIYSPSFFSPSFLGGGQGKATKATNATMLECTFLFHISQPRSAPICVRMAPVLCGRFHARWVVLCHFFGIDFGGSFFNSAYRTKIKGLGVVSSGRLVGHNHALDDRLA